MVMHCAVASVVYAVLLNVLLMIWPHDTVEKYIFVHCSGAGACPSTAGNRLQCQLQQLLLRTGGVRSKLHHTAPAAAVLLLL
jgi:hypothetical protein